MGIYPKSFHETRALSTEIFEPFKISARHILAFLPYALVSEALGFGADWGSQLWGAAFLPAT
jgi:hypothetical protein